MQRILDPRTGQSVGIDTKPAQPASSPLDTMSLEDLCAVLIGELAMLAALSIALQVRTAVEPYRVLAEAIGQTKH